MTILIGGGSGLVGSQLVKLLTSQGHEVRVLSRTAKVANGITYFQWDINTMTINPKALEGVTHVINLAGAGIADKRWSKKRKDLIISSRVRTTQILANAIQKHGNQVERYVAASAIGFYGDRADENLKESSNNGTGFLAESTRLWEQSIHQLDEALNIPVTILRFGIVLSKQGGALEQMLLPLKFGVSGYFGSGKQWYSWIHIKDVCSAIHLCLAATHAKGGTFNLVAPNPVTNKTFAQILAKVSKGFAVPLPVPSFLLKKVLGEMSHVVLDSTKVDAKKLQNELLFKFQYPELEGALKDILS